MQYDKSHSCLSIAISFSELKKLDFAILYIYIYIYIYLQQ